MTPGPWRTAYASAVGTAHARASLPCQDDGRCETVLAADGSEILLASVSDGSGSASQAEHGARLVIESFHRSFAVAAREDPSLDWLDAERARAWLAGLQAEIALVALQAGFAAGEYAATCLGAVVTPTAAAFLQIGDGAIVTDDGGAGHHWVFWPQHGEFANSTYFVTMADAADMLCFDKREAPVRELALFSDGLERLILDMRAQTVHSPSLRPVFDWLASTGSAPASGPSDVLAAYLNSPNVNRRTDDDKTLVMAVRAADAGPA